MKTSINKKFMLFIVPVFIVMGVTIFLFAGYSLKRIIDANQLEIYTEKIETIIEMLNRKHDMLTHTFQVDAYEESFKESFLDEFIRTYYGNLPQGVTPFIMSTDGRIVAHPSYPRGYMLAEKVDFFEKMVDLKNGSFDYTLDGTRKWMVFHLFDDWNWIVGYAVAHDVKYASYILFRNILIILIFTTTLASVGVVLLLVTRFTRPLYTLTRASSELASGNLDYPVDVTSGDEFGKLAESFITMRNAIKEKIADLHSRNDDLQQEITDRKRIAAELRISEQRYRLLVENMDDLIIKFDKNRQLVYVNPAYCRACGKSKDELIGTSCVSLVHHDDQRRVQEVLDTLFTAPFVSRHEERTMTKDGWRWYSWSSRAMLDDNGGVVEVIAVGRDITDRKNAEQEREHLIRDLEEKNTEMESFTYTVSHDLKSPLVTIMGFLNVIKNHISQKEYDSVESYTDRVLNAAEKMRLLIEGLLNLARIGRIANPREKIVFADLVREVTELLSNQIDRHGVEVVIDDDLPVVYGDRQRLMEVVLNLMENAIKFTRSTDKPTVQVGSQNSNGEQYLFIQDNGIGIEPHYLQKIFGLFDKLDESSSGTGIGLAVVKRIIEYHNGMIWAESEGPGTGTKFCFTLPLES